MNRSYLVVLPLLLAVNCGGSGSDSADADTLTRRQKDSIVGEMPLPGAGGVRDLLETSDSIQSRSDRLDSLNRR